MKHYDVVIVGAGHAGCEAASASARLGVRTLLVTTTLAKVATLPCNPSIGGPGKGHVVREIGALGGLMARVADSSAVQIKELNTSKGPAVRAYRAQIEQETYNQNMLAELKAIPNLDFYEDEVKEIITEPASAPSHNTFVAEGCLSELSERVPEARKFYGDSANHRVVGIRTGKGTEIATRSVIICTGTFMTGQIIIGDRVVRDGGRMDEGASIGLTGNLNKLGLTHGRLKTGTPPRIDKDSLDYSVMEVAPGTPGAVSFSYPNNELMSFTDQIPCHLTYTTPQTHRLILDNLQASPIANGTITERAPRSCPSLDRKVMTFPDRDRHPIFIEPTGRTDQRAYIQGGSLAFPEELQERVIRTIPGMEAAKFLAYGYAVVYDFFPPHQINPSLETKTTQGLYLAGQINGTTGYEEAAAQGLMAGINAARGAQNLAPLVLRRDQAYIGVLIDDLVTKIHVEPYRLFTSRAEYRLLLRNDNADIRLAAIGHQIGLVSEAELARAKHKEEETNTLVARLKTLHTKVDQSTVSAHNLLARPEHTIGTVRRLFHLEPTSAELDEQVELNVKYSGYFAKQSKLATKTAEYENHPLAHSLDYGAIKGLRNEARLRLREVRPATIGQAGRIQGVTPADLSILMVANRRALVASAR